MKTVTNKEAAKKLLRFFGKNGERWTTEYLAKNKTGKNVAWDAPSAMKWCVIGASFKLNLDSFNEKLRDASQKKHWTRAGAWNDTILWAGVKKMLQIAAKTGRIVI